MKQVKQTKWGQSNLDANEQGKLLNGGKNVEGSGHGMAKEARQANTACRTATAGEHSRRTLRPAQASKKTTASSWPASQQKQQLPEDVGLPLAVQCR